MSYFENISVNFQKDGTTDVFGRLKVGNSENLFDTKTLYDKRDIFFTESLVSGATSVFVANNSCVDLTVNTTNGSTAIRQTREYFNYESGRAMFVSISFILGAKKTNVVKRIGLFDALNGFFLKQDGSSLNIVRRTSTSGTVVDNEIPQSSWNIDKLDGTGPSGFSLDETKIQLMSIEYTWQGAGHARFGFYFNNQMVICHEEVFSNVLTTVSITTPCLPIRFEITNTAVTSSSTTLRCICMSVNSEGGYSPRGITYSAINSSTVTVNTNSIVGLLAIRLKAANNRIPVILKNIGILTSGNNPMQYRCLFNPTVTGGAWVSAGTSSAVEYNQNFASFSGGEIIKTGFISAQSRQQVSLIQSSFKLTSDINGTSGIFLIAGDTSGALGNTSARASMDWLEEW